MEGSYDPQRGCDSQVENHWSSTTCVGTHMVSVVVAVSLIPRNALTPLPGICRHVLLAALLGGSTPGPLMHSRSLSRAFPWEQAVADPLPQQTNPSPCTSWGSLVLPGDRFVKSLLIGLCVPFASSHINWGDWTPASPAALFLLSAPCVDRPFGKIFFHFFSFLFFFIALFFHFLHTPYETRQLPSGQALPYYVNDLGKVEWPGFPDT